MIAAVLQTLAAIVAGVLLFRLWRAALPRTSWLRYVVAAGFLLRALIGQALFWISWARFPLLPSLQEGGGLWSFALDGILYLRLAADAASDGLGAIATLSRAIPAPVYVQLLGLTTWLVGGVASASLLLNLFCYLGAIALLARQGDHAATPIVAVSLFPAFVLWSLQPLKESLFTFLFVAFVCACAAWQRTSTRQTRWRTRASIALLMGVLLAALAGIRWYFAFALLGATTLFLLLAALRGAERKLVSVPSAALLVLLLAHSVLLGGGPKIPPPFAALLSPTTAPAAMADLPAALPRAVSGAREDFARTGGRTVIQPPAPRERATASPAPATSPDDVRLALDGFIDAWNRGDVERVVATFDDSSDVELWNGSTRIRGAGEVRDAYRAFAAAAEEEVVALSDVRIRSAGTTATAAARWTRHRGRWRQSGLAHFVLRRRADGWRIVRLSTDLRELPPDMQLSGADAPPPAALESRRPARPASAKLLGGMAAILLPRSVAEAAGWFRVGGGRGMLWVTDVDTLAFDLALGFVVVIVARRFGAAWRTPLFWLLVALTLAIAIPLAYSVTNFGTLFRLRGMVYAAIILLPLAVRSGPAADAAP